MTLDPYTLQTDDASCTCTRRVISMTLYTHDTSYPWHLAYIWHVIHTSKTWHCVHISYPQHLIYKSFYTRDTSFTRHSACTWHSIHIVHIWLFKCISYILRTHDTCLHKYFTQTTPTGFILDTHGHDTSCTRSITLEQKAARQLTSACRSRAE